MLSPFKTVGAVVCLVFALCFAAPYAQADSFTPVFTCSGSCLFLPTALDVSFPSPTLTITLAGTTFSLTLPAADLPGDAYRWNATTNTDHGGELADFTIHDDTANTLTHVDLRPFDMHPNHFDGPLTFTPVATATPEPSSLAFMLSGVGIVFAMRKRSSGLQQVS